MLASAAMIFLSAACSIKGTEGTLTDLLPLFSSAQEGWDRTKWPDAEPYSADLAKDFTWKPGVSNQPLGTARGIFPGRVVMARYPEAARWAEPHPEPRSLRALGLSG